MAFYVRVYVERQRREGEAKGGPMEKENPRTGRAGQRTKDQEETDRRPGRCNWRWLAFAAGSCTGLVRFISVGTEGKG